MTTNAELGTTDVLIAGAGPTGLLLACELQRLGLRVRVVDPKAGPTRESRAMVVQARTLEIYDQLGLAEEAVRQGHPVSGLNAWSGDDFLGGLPFGVVGRGQTPYPYILSLEQSKNEALLYTHLRALGGEVDWGWALEDFSQDAGGVRITLGGPNGGVRSVRAAYLCGTDGAHSPVRHLLGLPFDGERSPRTLFVADVTTTGALDNADLSLKLSASSLLLTFPLASSGRGDNRLRLIGMPPAGELEGSTPTFEDVRALVRDVFGIEVSQVRWFSHYRVSHRVARHFRTGRVFLLGDAAHVHSPVGGQGMNTGLGDAHNLGWKLAAVLKGQASPGLLDTYGAERRPFAQSLVRTTDRAFRLISSDTPLSRRLRTRLLPAVLRRLGAGRGRKQDSDGPNTLGRLAFRMVSQLRLSYPHSPLSRGQAGKIRGGERLPYAQGSRNFKALRRPGPQLHLYGTPSPEVLSWCLRRDISLHVFPFEETARRAGLREDAAYLVRPDGYVSVAQATFGGAELDRVLRAAWYWRAEKRPTRPQPSAVRPSAG
ncbi:FAD-dependent monooxygenase [Deinococcus hopiensis]|uniref:2-polyprenyl-6-methoxyphenol hydroxylase n=1 Tax=Deinococcus hopiensis KR-140 TaxID=695939 RepID=A0A1W1VN36_9DEIO|nr:FAD-dependent monooxygenase [Deinococcus hopiensis]SMB94736.1 2-polyprenyl-6-methoxyphenol hydroxylase [Deinococcus hopiensis KR-140]